jgi:hypothetical protein
MSERIKPLQDFVHRLRSVVEAELHGDFGPHYLFDDDCQAELALAEQIHALIEKRRKAA